MTTGTADPLDPARLKFVLIVSVLAMAASGLCALLHAGWLSAWIVTVGTFLVIYGYAMWKADRVLVRLMVFGFVVAVGEILGADRWAVQMRTLVYAPYGPFVVKSPAYMLASWTVATVQFSMLGLWLSSKLKPWQAAVACALVGGTNLPVYESLAYYADWWFYQNAPMVLHAPYYVILGEVFIGMVFPWVAGRVMTRKWAEVPVYGALLGAWMLVAALISYRLIG